jgi:hypothetical protein
LKGRLVPCLNYFYRNKKMNLFSSLIPVFV